MIVVDLDAPTVAAIRLAASPLAETAAVLRLCASGRRDAVFGDVGAPARAVLADRDVALLAAVVPPGGTGYFPDFLTPTPLVDGDSITGQLEAVRWTPGGEVHQQVVVERFADRRLPREVARAVSDGSFARRAAYGLDLVWRSVLRDRWPNLRRLLDADIARRLQSIGRFGVARTIGTLHPDVRFDGRTLSVRMPPWNERGRLERTELVLTPSLFGWPRVSPQLCRAGAAVLRYPAHGVGLGRQGDRQSAVAALIGATRSALLADLDTPRSTAALSERHRLSSATVSYHLGILHECGLVLRTRAGHTVLYERSPRAALLLS